MTANSSDPDDQYINGYFFKRGYEVRRAISDAQELDREFGYTEEEPEQPREDSYRKSFEINMFNDGLGGIFIGGNYYPEAEARALWEDGEDCNFEDEL